MSVRVRKVDHVGIAVRSIREASKLFIDVLGGEFVSGGDEDWRNLRTVQIRLGGFKIELMEATSEDSYLARYIEKHGQGFHHMTMFVEDLGEAIAELEGKGYELVDTSLERPSWRESYLRPRSGFGTLIQLAETDREWNTSFEGVTLDAVLAGDATTIEGGFALRSAIGGGT